MGVLVEALSVIVPVTAIIQRYPGGLRAYEAAAPNRTFCCDGHLTRLGFMVPADVETYVRALESHGLEFHDGTEFVDIVVVDQFSGPTAYCNWLAVGRHPLNFSVAWLRGTSPSPMAAPNGWTIGQSNKLQFTATEDAARRLLPLLHEDSVSVLLDFATGKEVYIGRSYKR